MSAELNASPVARLVERVNRDLRGVPASDGRQSDEIVAAIVEVASAYGFSATPAALVHGLPLVEGRLPIEHAPSAAERAGLDLRLETRDPLSLGDVELPAIMACRDGTILVLHAIERGPPARLVVAPPSIAGERITLDRYDISQRLDGRILTARPRSGSAECETAGTQSARRGAASKYAWFVSGFVGCRSIYAKAIAATLAINLLALAMPLFTMNVYDRVLPNNAAESMWALAIGVVIATLFDIAIKMLRAGIVDAASRQADVRLANLIYGRLIGAKLPERQVSAGVRANTLREFETLRDLFNSATLTAFGDMPFLVIYLLAIAVIAGPLVVVPLAALPIVIAIGLVMHAALARRMADSFRETAQKNAVIVETLVGLETIKASGAESWAAGRWEASVAEHVRSGLAIRHLSNLGVNVVAAAQTLIQVVMVIAGFYMVAAGQITSGALIAATMLAGRALVPLGALAMLISRLNQAQIAFTALSEIVNAPQERESHARLITRASFKGEIELDRVSFGYEKDAEFALKDVSLRIAPGERVGVLGAIGSGKSTLLRLLQGLNDASSGRVMVDGLPVRQIDPAILREHMSLLLPGPELFAGTIRSNITLAWPGAPDEAIIAAAHAAGALEWIGRMPRGFDTAVRERGTGLSSGQRQSVALARALLRRPRMLLLDEPTSDMDGRSEQLVVERLKSFAAGRTLVVVTHRPALIDLVDRLIVIDAGRITHDGAKADVMKALKEAAEKRSASPATTPRRSA